MKKSSSTPLFTPSAIQQAIAILIVGASCVAADAAHAAEHTALSEQRKLIRSPNAVGVLGVDLFGDKVNFYNGSLEFVQVDVSLPGNNKLPVSVGRRLSVGGENLAVGMFREWDLEIPRIHGMFSSQDGWQKEVSGAITNQRCTNFGKPPPVTNGQTTFHGFEFWHGNMLYIPGVGEQEVLQRTASNTNVPNGTENTPLITKNNWVIRCIDQLASTDAQTPVSDRGQGFLAISPDGTRYQFDWLVRRTAISLTKPAEAQAFPFPSGTEKHNNYSMTRSEVWILPTLVTDRFGNTVRYVYDSFNKSALLRIEASDGRVLTMDHEMGTNYITAVSDGTRTWTYGYGVVDSNRNMLTTVTLPDGSKWQLAGLDGGRDYRNLAGLEGLVQMKIEYKPDPEEPPARCEDQPSGMGGPTGVGTMVHPSGAIGRFTMTPTTHARNNVPRGCFNDGTTFFTPYHPVYTDAYALTEKVIEGPGLPTLKWTNDYYGTYVPGWDDCEACKLPAVVLSTDPKGQVTRYTFGSTYAVDEGLLKQVDVGWSANGTALRTTYTRYNQSFIEPVGITEQIRGDSLMTTRLQPRDQTIVQQQGVSFNWEVPASSDFDKFARPKKVVRSSSLGYVRTEQTEYHDNLSSWVLGQVKSVTETSSNKVMVENSYDPITSNLLSEKRFGKLGTTMSYYPDGTLKTLQDGASQTITLSDYKRGIARRVVYADNTAETAVVNDIGVITDFTDATNSTTKYGYDAMGRISDVIYPADPVGWHATRISFTQSPSSYLDLAAGHWKQIVQTGNAVTTKYFDALWRPVYTETQDSARSAASFSVVKQDYEFSGQVKFASYPQRRHDALGPGLHTTFDALDRVTDTRSDSELGTLTTTTIYGQGFAKQHKDARGKWTTSYFQAFDSPTEEALIRKEAPMNTTIEIKRDIFGKPFEITSRDLTSSASRKYVYDANEQLCKTIEPETGATIQEYDAANNVAWRAPGLALNGMVCDRASVASAAKINFTYDRQNRLKDTVFGDGSAGIYRTYWADGQLATLSSNGAIWTLNYNNRRLPTTQVLSFAGDTFSLLTEYDQNGSVAAQNYPSEAKNPIAAKRVAYEPDALGRPTKVGSFASNVTYHPSGAIAGFTYGNGTVRTMDQNVRGLPEWSHDAGIVKDQYNYDENGNVLGIQDHIAGNMSTRALGYDDLNRLNVANAPKLWGNASYTYNALDNITSTSIGTRSSTYQYDSSNKLEAIQSSAAGYSFGYQYDPRGNVTRRGNQTYAFDLGNRLTTATGLETYHYDGFGRRVLTTGSNGSSTMSVYNPSGQLVYTRKNVPSQATEHTQYIYLHKHQIAEVKR